MLKFGSFRRIRRGNTVAPPTAKLWSDTATWGGTVPVAGDNVTVAAGDLIDLDVNTANSLGVLTIAGTLRWPANSSAILRCQGIRILSTGKLQVGNGANAKHTAGGGIELTGTRVAGTIVGLTHFADESARTPSSGNDTFFGVDGLSRGIVNQGGIIDIQVATPTVLRTKLTATAAAAATVLAVEDTLAWGNGAAVIVAPTGYYGNQNTEQFFLGAAATSTTVTLNTGLAAGRWGQMQYLRDDGIGLTVGTFSTMQANSAQRSTLDERAKVALLSRPFFIRGADDAEWANKRFGAHIMTMGPLASASMIIDGVEILRCGQAGVLGRYPIHWHMLSYNNVTGATLGTLDPALNRVENCAIWQSANRAMTIHGTRGAMLRNNVCYDIAGQAVFLEDGSEEDNFIIGNWVGKVRDPNLQLAAVPGTITTGTPGTINATGHPFQNGDEVVIATGSPTPGGLFGPSSFGGATYYYVVNRAANSYQLSLTPAGSAIAINSAPSGFQMSRNLRLKLHDANPSGFWITNANNEFRLNSAFDCQRVGIWNTLSPDRTGFPGGCFGQSSQVPIHPEYTRPKMAADGVTPLYDDNETHSNGEQGALTNFCVVSERGVTSDTNGGKGGPLFKVPANSGGTEVNGIFSRMFVWKNRQGGYSNRVQNPIYRNWVQADNLAVDFFGQTQQNKGNEVQAPVVIGFSLNSGETPPSGSDLSVRNAFASYHGALDFVDVTAYNYPFAPPIIDDGQSGLLLASAVLQTWDLYTKPVETDLARARNWKLFNSNPMYRTPPPHIINDAYDTWTGNQPKDINFQSATKRNWSHAGAVYDRNGVLGGTGENYNIFDVPYLTTGLSSSTVLTPSYRMSRVTAIPFYGMYPLADDTSIDEFTWRPATRFDRLDPTTQAQISGATWEIADGDEVGSVFLQGMHHGACPRNGWVLHRRPAVDGNKTIVPGSFVAPYTTRYAVRITNCKRVTGFDGATNTDMFFLAIPWSGAVAPTQIDAAYNSNFATFGIDAADYLDTGSGANKGRAVRFASVASLAALTSATVPSYFRDTTNNLLYLKIMPWSAGSTYNPTNVFHYSDNRGFNLYIKA